MKNIFLLLLLMVLEGFLNTSYSSGNISIMNGSIVTDPSKYPFIVSVEDNENRPGSRQHECGGTLIAPEWVLTAGHCVSYLHNGNVKNPEQIIIRYDTVDFDANPGQLSQVSRIFVYPKYKGNYEYALYDIALIKLKTPINKQTVMLPFPFLPKKDYSPGQYATVIGWGLYEYPPTAMSPQLREASLPIMFNQDVTNSPGSCGRNTYHDFFDGELMIGTQPENNQTANSGDSGGPLLIKNDSGYVQIGIVSWNDACGDDVGKPGNPEIYTRLTNPLYIDWVYRTIYQNSLLM